MEIYLVQHGESLPKKSNSDPSLNDQGITNVKRIANVANDYDVPVRKIIHSVKARARETAVLFAEQLIPQDGVEEVHGLKPTEDPVHLAREIIDLPDSWDNVMIVGHQPFMGKLASILVTGTADISVFSFQQGGIVCISDTDESEGFIISWALMPYISYIMD